MNKKAIEARNAFMNALDCYIDSKHTIIHEDRGYVSHDLSTKALGDAIDELMDAIIEGHNHNMVDD